MLVAVLATLPFLPALGAGFVSWDDDQNFVTNLAYRGLGPEQLSWMWSTFHLGHYTPLTWMTLGLDHALWGMDPRGYHLTNLLLHATTASLLFVVAQRLLRAAANWTPSNVTLAAAFAALVFAVHPLRVESVAWVTERRDVLSECLALASVLCWFRLRPLSPWKQPTYWASVVLFLFGLLSKATILTLPALLLLLAVYPLRWVGGATGWWSAESRRLYASLVPFALLSAASAVMSFVALQPVTQLAVPGKAAVSFYSLAFYSWKTIAPIRLSPLYAMPAQVDPFTAKYLLSAFAVLAISLGAWAVRRRWPAVPVAWLAFVIALFPMLGIHQNGPQIAADRYTYHAAPALALLAASALALLLGTRHRRLALTGAGTTLLVLGSLSWRQAGIWHDSATLWEQVARLDSGGWIGRNNWGNVLMSRDRFTDAEVEFRGAVTLNPRYAEAQNNLGVALARQRRPAEALGPLRRALALDSAYDEAAVNLGAALAQLGDDVQAIALYRRALAIDPSNAAAQMNWGNALLRQGRAAEAAEHHAAARTLFSARP